MNNIKYRVDLNYIPQNQDFIKFIEPLGTGHFLVLHKKTDNYHYHGFFQTSLSTRTIRRNFKTFLNSTGNGAYSVGDKVPESDRYKSYCLFRSGHPIETIICTDDVEQLRKIHDEINSINHTEQKSLLKIEVILRKLKPLIKPNMSLRAILVIITDDFRKNNQILHKANITQLGYTLYAFSHDSSDSFVDALIGGDEGFQGIIQNEYRAISRTGPPIDVSETFVEPG